MISTEKNRLVQKTALAIALAFSILCTAASASAQSVTPPVEAFLTVLATPVQLTSGSNAATALEQDATIGVQLADGINVDEGGRGLLKVGDRLAVDIFRGTEFSLANAELQPDDSIFAQLKQTHGHTHVTLSETANVRVKLETDFATITTLKPGTEFLVCHDPTLLTCLDVRRGAVEVVGQGKVVTVKAGESTYVLKGQPPVSPPICEHPAEVSAWLDQMLSVGQVEPLGALVDRWRGQPCPSGAPGQIALPAVPTTVPTPSIPPGVYVTALRTEPPPVRGIDLKFVATFLNTIGQGANYRWKVYIYRIENPNRSFGETSRTDSTISSGTVELASVGSWKIPKSGGCEQFFAQVGSIGSDSRITWFTMPNGQIFQKSLTLCP